MWEHHAHLKDIYVKVGQRVKHGQTIGTLGGTGNVTAPHLHYEIWKVDPKTRPKTYNSYTQGLTKAQVQAIYADPNKYRTDVIPTRFSHFGNKYLVPVSPSVLHPGIDINGPGNDTGQEVKAWFDGIVEFVQFSNAGFGNHVFIREDKEQPTNPVDNSMIYLKDWSDADFNKLLDMGFFKGNYSNSGPKNKQEWIAAYGNLTLWQLLETLYKHDYRERIAKRLEDSFKTGKQVSRKEFYK